MERTVEFTTDDDWGTTFVVTVRKLTLQDSLEMDADGLEGHDRGRERLKRMIVSGEANGKPFTGADALSVMSLADHVALHRAVFPKAAEALKVSTSER